MLSAHTPTQGSARYVAIEPVNGVLEGKTGTFVLQHYGPQNEGRNTLILEVVPHSGIGELTGLTGKMHITLENGHPQYRFDFGIFTEPAQSVDTSRA